MGCERQRAPSPTHVWPTILIVIVPIILFLKLGYPTRAQANAPACSYPRLTMQREYVYLMKSGLNGDRLLSDLRREREGGNFLGSTYTRGRCHSCFNDEQINKVRELARKNEAEYQTTAYYSGDILDDDFDSGNFRKDFVHWCPSPIYSQRFNQHITDDDKWGLTMEGNVTFGCEFAWITQGIIGFIPIQNSDTNTPDSAQKIYQITGSCQGSVVAIGDKRILKLTSRFEECADICRVGQTGAIICKTELTKRLKKTWSGLVYAKFQPILK